MSRTFPLADFSGNLAAFCRFLRSRYGFRVGPGEIIDAARVLAFVDIARPRQVRDAWRAVLASDHATSHAFDEAFNAFFLSESLAAQHARAEQEREDAPPTAGSGDPSSPPAKAEAIAGDEGGAPTVAEDDQANGTGPDAEGEHAWSRAAARALDIDGVEIVELYPADGHWRDAARALVRRLEIGLARKWHPSRRHGRRFDLRRTWRASLQTGGEAVVPRWLRRVHRRPTIVLLIDGSRSMHGQTAPALALSVALAGAARDVHVFAFSTTVVPLTRQVRAAAAGRPARVTLPRGAWGGGTSIGDSLRTFLHKFGARLGPGTLVVIVSDGLDIGDTARLAQCMQRIHRRAAATVWLNPLAATPGFTPTSRGMRAARPFITTLSSVPDARAAVRLARTVRLRH